MFGIIACAGIKHVFSFQAIYFLMHFGHAKLAIMTRMFTIPHSVCRHLCCSALFRDQDGGDFGCGYVPRRVVGKVVVDVVVTAAGLKLSLMLKKK